MGEEMTANADRSVGGTISNGPSSRPGLTGVPGGVLRLPWLASGHRRAGSRPEGEPPVGTGDMQPWGETPACWVFRNL